MNRKSVLIPLLLLAMTAACGRSPAPEVQPAEPIKAVHYFADAWPKTFWQEFETAQLDEDIQRIRQDGFNTVILVVPWMGFELGFTDERTHSDPRMYARLDLLLDRISGAGLDYMLRVGYPHDFTPAMDTNNVELCLGMYAEEKTLAQWDDYLHKLQAVTDRYAKSLAGILISWEDFWCVHFLFPQTPEADRRQLAQRMGFDDWLKTQEPAVTKILMGVNDIRYDQVAIPEKTETAYYLYMKFIQERLAGRILQATKSVFPQAAMEVRVDKDPVDTPGGKIWIANDLFLDEKNHRGTYWAPFWGARNVGEKLTLEQAMANFEYFLRYVSNDGASTNHVIGQFNFYDNTPYFPNNAQIEESAVPAFITAVAPLISQYSTGYGLWAYQDYADNALYNASFEFGLEGWSVQGQPEVLEAGDEKHLSLLPGDQIAQRIVPAEQFMLSRVYEELSLCFWSHSESAAVISANDEDIARIEVTRGENCHSFDALPLTGQKASVFGFRALDELVIDELKLFGFVQSLGVYDEFGEPGKYRDRIRDLNQRLGAGDATAP
jgi:hypothetical protein